MSNHELIDIIDNKGEIVGTVTRQQAELENHVTQNVLIFVFTSTGQVWAQLRPMSKNHFPGRWDISAAGGVVSGESHRLAARREAEEELGFALDLTYVETFLNIFPGDEGEERRRLSHLYIAVSDETPQPNKEVDEFKAWVPKELREDIKQNPHRYLPPFLVELDKALAFFITHKN